MRSLAFSVCAAATTIAALGCASKPTAVAEAPPTARPVQTVVTADAQRALTPQQVLADLQAGNRRFVEGRATPRDYLAQARVTAADGQYPKAVVLGCLDSRVPPEIIFDQGIGDIFVGRVAGNVEDTNMLGSMEFATKAAGSKLIVVLGHTSCGAIKGAIDGVRLGNLTELLDDFDDPVRRAQAAAGGEATSSNAELLNLAIEENVRQTISDILEQSQVISDMVDAGEVAVVGAIYDLSSGQVRWLESER